MVVKSNTNGSTTRDVAADSQKAQILTFDGPYMTILGLTRQECSHKHIVQTASLQRLKNPKATNHYDRPYTLYLRGAAELWRSSLSPAPSCS